jgi:hypothetical protein
VDELDVNASEETRVLWQGPVEIDGKLWPIQSDQSVLAPAGKHRLRAGTAEPAVRIADFNGKVRSAVGTQTSVDVSYSSRSRAVALFGSPVSVVHVDGAPFWKRVGDDKTNSIVLPSGQHVVTFDR